MKKILITGGAGYIGSHTLVELSSTGLDFIVYDNLSNSSKEALKRVEKITDKSIEFVEGDIRDKKLLQEVFSKYNIDSVIHFAGLKAVGESIAKPLEYYDNNVNGTLTLLEVMQDHNCKKIVFSSSATVYGDPKEVPVTEEAQTGIGITNPYGRSKYFIEEILKDLYVSDNSWKIAILRYFNPIGAHESGLIGEDPEGIPNNLMPYISQVAVGKLKELQVFGDDYDTIDGTGVRDYIHVVDLANAHVKAVEYLNNSIFNTENSPLICNLGTGKGYSVLGIVQAFIKASGAEVPYKIVARRDGDIAICYANPKKANELLDWEAKRDIEQMCKDSWNWQSKNPRGYKTNNSNYRRNNMDKIIALLPMKGTSERVPSKNMRDFNGKPLYHAVMETLLKSKYIDKVVIDTDSSKIAEDAKSNFGNKVLIIDRPQEIQGGNVSMNVIIDYDLSQLNGEYFLQTHSTNPLLRVATLDKAIETYFENLEKYDSVFAVTKVQTRFYDENAKPINHNPNELLRTQDLEPLYEENSNFYIFSKKSFKNAGNKRIGLKPQIFEVNKLEAVDIDEPEDFKLAELLYMHKDNL